MKVLLADYNRDELSFFAHYLSKNGHEVHTAPNMAGTLGKILGTDPYAPKNSFDAIIVDVQVPKELGKGHDELWLLNRLKEKRLGGKFLVHGSRPCYDEGRSTFVEFTALCERFGFATFCMKSMREPAYIDDFLSTVR